MHAYDVWMHINIIYVGYLQEYRVMRAEKIRLRSLAEQKRAKHARLDHQIFINQNPHTPSVIRFHPYEPHLAVADKDTIRYRYVKYRHIPEESLLNSLFIIFLYLLINILLICTCSIWDWEQGIKLNNFRNLNPRYSRITSMDFVNGHDQALILTGSDDGSVRVWRHYEEGDGLSPRLVTAWQALSDMLQSSKSRLSSEWFSHEFIIKYRDFLEFDKINLNIQMYMIADCRLWSCCGLGTELRHSVCIR